MGVINPASALSLPGLPSVDTSLGASLVAVLVESFMFGILTLQVYLYFNSYRRDPTWLRIWVGVVWCLDFAHSILGSAIVYHYLITNYLNPLANVKNDQWTFKLASCITPVTIFMTQSYFGWRAWRLDKTNIFLAGSILFWAFAQLGVGLGWAIRTAVKLQTIFEISTPREKASNSAWLASAFICDVLITYYLVSTLRKAKTGYIWTDTIISKLIVWSVNTGLLTTFFALVDLVCFASMDNLIHGIFNFLLAKLYTNTFLATLNARKAHKNPGSSSTEGSGGSGSSGAKALNASPGNFFYPAKQVELPATSEASDSVMEFGGGGRDTNVSSTLRAASYSYDETGAAVLDTRRGYGRANKLSPYHREDLRHHLSTIHPEPEMDIPDEYIRRERESRTTSMAYAI